jgi:DNA-binding winged helix-turn-helix (wHTH) protein/TolB-like protein
MKYAFDLFVIDAAAREVSASGVAVQVEPKVLDLILHLIERRDRMVAKGELIDAIWQGRFISEAAISSAVSAARRALGDDGRQQRYIRTIHGRGFRFVGHVTEFAAPTLDRSTDAPAATTSAEEGFTFTPALVPGLRTGAPAENAFVAAAMASDPGQRNWPRVAVLALRHGEGDQTGAAIAGTVAEDLVAYLSRDRSLSVVLPHGEGIESHGLQFSPGQRTGLIVADYLVEGSVRQAGGSLAIILRLVDGHDGRHLWVERCVLEASARSSLDDQLARKLAAGIRNEIESNERAKAEAATELDFHSAYLKGSRELYRFTYQGLLNARNYFGQAIQRNPNSASAHARLSYVDIQLYWYGSPEARGTVLDGAIRGASHAVALDPKNSLSLMSLGRARALNRNLDDALPELEAAVGLDPSLAQLHFALGQTLCYAGQAQEAVRRLDAAVELNPYDPHLWAFLHDRSEAQLALGRLADAERDARAAARAPNATHWPWVTLSAVHGLAGNKDQAQEALHVLSSRRPGYNVDTARSDLSHYADTSFVDIYIDGLRRAGLR